MSTENESTDQNAADQKARAILRERFLRAVSQFSGKPCSMLTYEHSKLNGTFTAWKPDGSDILVSDLQTPAGIVIPAALLRTPDILAIHFEGPIQ
ncbi:gem-associated protein 7 [Amyelois transitella]|uniref:gem-associated protein 7 n=1 Tax=Amyelois transitella TaxID=680683 RepID=UPI00067E22FD|nr:gem-associated protein 7 [Amyelois transitella]